MTPDCLIDNISQTVFSSLTGPVDCFLSSRNCLRRFEISSLFCAYLSLSLRLFTSLGSAYARRFSISHDDALLEYAVLVSYLGFGRWLYLQTGCAWMMTYGILIFHYPPSVAAFKYIEELFVKHICRTNGTECTNLNLQAYIIMKHLKLIFFCTWCMPFSNAGSTCLAWITVHIGHATVI